MRILIIDSNTTGPFGLVSGDIAVIVVAYADGKGLTLLGTGMMKVILRVAVVGLE